MGARDRAVVARGEEIGGVVDIIGAAGNGRAEVAGREKPVGEAVVGEEQRAVEGEEGGGIGVVDGGVAVRAGAKEADEIGRSGAERGEIVAAAVAVAWMQAGLWRAGKAGRRAARGRRRKECGNQEIGNGWEE
jgi:hypothetical protein